jgi:hypothetical protein
VTPPFHASGEPAAIFPQDQSKYIGDSVWVCGCEADAGSRKIEDSAPPKRETLCSNPSIIVVRVTGCPAISVILGFGAQTPRNAKTQAMLTPHQNLLHYLLTLLLQHRRTPYFREIGLGLPRNLN